MMIATAIAAQIALAIGPAGGGINMHKPAAVKSAVDAPLATPCSASAALVAFPVWRWISNVCRWRSTFEAWIVSRARCVAWRSRELTSMCLMAMLLPLSLMVVSLG
jgi:hypothetical protein